MHISRIDLNLFTVFEAIYAEGSITRASVNLNLTQPAISHALNRLRALFEDPLFERQGHTMVPTPLARSIIGPVRQSLRGFEVTLSEAERFDPASSERTFSLAVRDVLEASLLPPLMAQIEDDAPSVGLNTLQVGRRELESELAKSGTYVEPRPLNLDPGYLVLGKFILATTKDQGHRIYLSDGIFAEVTLQFRGRAFEPWPWTYADYKTEVVKTFLLTARDYYRSRLESTRA